MRAERFVAIIASGAGAPVSRPGVELYGLTRCHEGPRFSIATDPRLGAIALGSGGVVLGTVFDRSAREPLNKIDAKCADEIIASDGATLITRFWGGFAAVLAGDGLAHVVRDPSGHLPCYWFEQAGTVVVTSDPAVCVDAGLLSPAIDWTTIAGHLLRYERRGRATALRGVTELMPGERLTIGAHGAIVTPLWQPWPFTRRDQAIIDDAEAVELVGRAVRNSVGAWGRCFQRPLVSLSGGLDSSVIAAAMARENPTCVTIATDEPGGDERGYARLVAERIAAPLVERRFDMSHVVLDKSAAARLPRPVARLFAQEVDRAWRETAEEVGADALFHGGGGDNVFCYLTSAAPLLDSLRVNGFGSDTRRALFDVAALTDSSVAAVLRAAVRKAIVDQGRYRWTVDRTGLSKRAIALGERAAHHPWFETMPNGILPGKQAHVAALVRIQNHIDAAEPTRIVPVLAPLLAQPVMETCLRVPSWMWCREGVNRSVARRAFARDLPAEIIDRRGKGTPDSFDASLVQTHRGKMLEMLADGALAAAGLLDLEWLRGPLARQGPLVGTDYLRMTMLVDVEAWLQSWAAMGATMSGPVNGRV